MKLITLNIWGGHVIKPLLAFIKSHQDIDIFCLQEVYHNAKEQSALADRIVHFDLFSQIQACLPNHQGFFRPVVDNTYGIAMFVSNKVNILSEGEIVIHEVPGYVSGAAHPRNLQWLECLVNDQVTSILNVHCLWNGRGKGDSPDRIAQSTSIKGFMDTINTPKILCGDFNLRPDTKSIEILEQGMTNLVKTHGVTSTRTSFYEKAERFADYILISPGITANHFAVLPDEVSDHAALSLDFQINASS